MHHVRNFSVLFLVCAMSLPAAQARAADCNAMFDDLYAFASQPGARLSAVLTTNQAAGRDAGVATVSMIDRFMPYGEPGTDNRSLVSDPTPQNFSDRGSPAFTGRADSIKLSIIHGRGGGPLTIDLEMLTWNNGIGAPPTCDGSVMYDVVSPDGNGLAITISFKKHPIP